MFFSSVGMENLNAKNHTCKKQKFLVCEELSRRVGNLKEGEIYTWPSCRNFCVM
jgi:hypothetical protein